VQVEAGGPDRTDDREKAARALYRDAQTAARAGNTLMALLLLDGVIHEYRETETAGQAREMADKLRQEMGAKAAVEAEIDRELDRIDDLIFAGNLQKALSACRALFRRYPDTERTREIMQRLRKIERVAR